MCLGWITEWMIIAVPELEEHRSRFCGKYNKRTKTVLKRIIFESREKIL